MNKKLFLIAPAFFVLGCSETTTEESTSTTSTKVEVAPEPVEVEKNTDEEIEAYLTEKGWEGVRHESGMYVVTDNLGKGDARPTLNDQVTIFYKGYYLNGEQFDGTTDAPATFALTQLIQGWQIGIPLFGKGGKGKLVIPSDLAYGPDDYMDIPGGSTLMFEIELVDWIAGPAQ